MEPCTANGPVTGCCLLAVPNTSSWQVVCASPSAAPTAVPMTTTTGAVLLAIALCLIACWKLR